MMTKHRIGRVQLPWANLEPPIRSENYYKNLAERKRLAAAPESEKSRRGRSVDLGSVGYPTLSSITVILGACSHTRPS
jgi:delta8-fatty-acid desaturase